MEDLGDFRCHEQNLDNLGSIEGNVQNEMKLTSLILLRNQFIKYNG